MRDERELRERLVRLLRGEDVHMTFDAAVNDFPLDRINEFPPNVAYSAWQLLEHMRITQKDIFDYIQDSKNYKERRWPEDYWPAANAGADKKKWQETLIFFREDLSALIAMAEDPAIDLFSELPDTPGHTIYRELLIIANHNSYHIGEFAILR